MKVKTKKARRTRVRLRQRQRIRGTAERPRLAVSRSLEHISAQVIDDQIGRTIASASSVEPALKVLLQNGARGGNTAGARVVGKAVAERALSAGIQSVRLDRGSYKYHGRVAALAAAVREAGLKI